MGKISLKLVEAARAASRRLAGRETPFLMNCWYVAGFAEDFTRELRARTLLGRPLVLFRAMDGRPTAMDDRCPHRSFPLSRGALDGDLLVCGYHGLTYDRGGACVAAPGQTVTPRGIAVRSYPLREQGPLVWIWMGESEPGADLPLGDWVGSPDWPSSHGYFHLNASYIALHENLLDLTHLSFLHAGTFGTPDYALAPYTIEADEAVGHFVVKRSVVPTRLPPVWAAPTGLADRDAARITTSEFLSPAAHRVTARFYGCDRPEAEQADMRISTGHLPTPETATSTHYFILHTRNFAVADASVTEVMHNQLWGAFQEDVDGLDALEATIAKTPPDDYFEMSISSDRAGLAMRRWLLAQVEAEAASCSPCHAGSAASPAPSLLPAIG